MPLPIEQYGLIGDCESAALVGLNGSIDWLCLPVFDSPACFAALLGDANRGRWLLAPRGKPNSVRRAYRGDTLILETSYETAQGAVTVVDCMAPRDGAPMVVRMVQGRRGKVRMHMELKIRFDYGSIVPWVRRIETGIHAVAGPDTLNLHTPVDLQGQDLATVAEFDVSEGEEVPFVLEWRASHHPHRPPANAAQTIASTEDWWRDWADDCNYAGPWRDAVMRSLITLKALTYGPSGGIVAAPTTSLPEQLGGVRNWDYRFCWLRDASFTLDSLLSTGFRDEAKDFRNWLLRAVAGDPCELQIMYGLLGSRRLIELELDWLDGYESSKPVRTGNLAWQQFQLDVYGQVGDMLHLCRQQGLPASDAAWRFECALLRFLEEGWRRPDDGIWETRGPRQHFTHSKAMTWVAFDRAIKAVEEFGQEGPVEHWRQTRNEIHREVCARGFNERLGSFVQAFDGQTLDASVLRLPLVGFLPADDPRVQGTLDAIGRGLLRNGFVHRYDSRETEDGLPPGEASFLPCSFWYVDNLALAGRRDEAVEMFERLLSICNDLGLLSEAYDVSSQRLLGNFPQAFSHVGLVNSALNLAAMDGATQASE